MLTAKDVKGVMAMMPAFGTADAGDLQSPYTVDLDNMTDGINRMIGDGIDIITTTGSFGECYNLYWEEFQDLAKAAVETVKKRVPLFIGTTSPNPRDVVRKMKFVQELKADGV
nr:aldolase [Deltaproteobacteria bacterium]